MTKKTSYKDILLFVEKNGSKLITTEKEFNDKKMNFTCIIQLICNCDIEMTKTIRNFKRCPNCAKCSLEIRKDTCMKKYGVESYTKTDEYKTKSKETCLEKYGVGHPMQNPLFFDNILKQLYKRKKYTFSSGNNVALQGFEPYFMDELLEIYDEKEILTDAEDMPEFWYYMKGCSVARKYFPDFYIPKANLIVEIKSAWSFSTDLEKNMEKFKTVKYSSFNFKVIIFDDKKNSFDMTHLIR